MAPRIEAVAIGALTEPGRTKTTRFRVRGCNHSSDWRTDGRRSLCMAGRKRTTDAGREKGWDMDASESGSEGLRYLEPHGRLKPANAAVALIVDEMGRYLMQLRDAKPTIFFPDHWGCFGGAVEPGETDECCLARELDEELGLDLRLCAARHFTTFTFDFSFAGGSVIHRAFFEVKADSASLANVTLREGREMRLFPGPELLAMQVVPYDRFAIWMHNYRKELGG